jgi:hypothetical protein
MNNKSPNDLSSAIAKSLDSISDHSKRQANKNSSPVLLKQQILRFLHNLNQTLSESHQDVEFAEQVKKQKAHAEHGDE